MVCLCGFIEFLFVVCLFFGWLAGFVVLDCLEETRLDDLSSGRMVWPFMCGRDNS